MQAYRVKGIVDHTGHLVVTEPIELSAGEVEVLVLKIAQQDTGLPHSDADINNIQQVNCEIPSLQQWLAQTSPVPADFEPEQAKWEHMEEKYNL
jgi:hypothetical protein